MDVIFADNSLRTCYETNREGVRRWGAKIARRYVDRVNRLYAAESAQDLFAFPDLKFHPLREDRKGQFAMNIDAAWRLIVTFKDREMKVVRVEEVTDHYGD